MTRARCATPSACSILIVSGSPRGTREPRGDRRIACSGVHQTTHRGEVFKGSGRSTACRLKAADSVPKGPRVVFLNDQAPGTRRVPPPPRAASRLRLRRAVPVSSADRCGTRKSRAKTLRQKCWPCSDNRSEPKPDTQNSQPNTRSQQGERGRANKPYRETIITTKQSSRLGANQVAGQMLY